MKHLAPFIEDILYDLVTQKLTRADMLHMDFDCLLNDV